MKKDYCFVIMPFSEEMKGVYEDVIKPSVEQTGLACLRVDEVEGTGNIVRKIIEYICDARVIVADLTHRNANVFYELGIAHSLGDKTIVIAQNISQDVPFDVKSYKVIQYEDSIRGARRLNTELVQAINSLETWSASPSNPVQDFLPDKARKTVTVAELKKTQTELAEKEQQLGEYQRKLSEWAKDRAEINKLKGESQELKILRDLVERLFKNQVPPEQLNNKSGMAEVVQEIIHKVETEGEVSVDVNPEQPNPKASPGKLIFKRIN